MSTVVANESVRLLQFLQDRIAEIAGKAGSTIGVNTPLSSIGVDSLGMLHLVEVIESELGADVPDNVCLDRLTIRALAHSIAERSHRPVRITDAVSQMMADAQLPEDIRPATACTRPVPQTILLTGATGFLGAFLVRSLICNTEARILCLARPDIGGAEARVRQNLQRYGIWDDQFHDRLAVIEADITQPRLGLSPSAFDTLADDVDLIVHAAASVNWVQPYARLRATNVLAVREMLRLACRRRTKPFHFISSLAACYSTTGKRAVSEDDDLLANIDGVHLAYAQSKCVAESLVRAAAQRGVPASIIRPALISGDSINGLSNLDDLVSALLKTCIHMGAAPDLDWLLDLLPVDFAAEAIIRLALMPNCENPGVFHLANPKSRHWRELILWMNLYGHSIQLVPYDQWLTLLKDDVRRTNDHPLRELLPFFAGRAPGQNEFYLPQLYEECRRRRVCFESTNEYLLKNDLQCPRLSTQLLDLYFESFVERSFLPRVHARNCQVNSPGAFDAPFFREITGIAVIHAEPLDFTPSNSVIGELTSWKYGRSIGLHRYRLQCESRGEYDVVVKVKPRDSQVTAVGQTLADLCHPALGKAYSIYSDCLGLLNSDTRELAVYQQDDLRFRRFTPRFFGGRFDGDRTVLILENLSSLEMMNTADSHENWDTSYVEAAILGIAEMHSIHYGKVSSAPNDTRFAEALELWTALANHAQPIFSQWIGSEFRSIQAALLDRIADIASMRCELPATWIHNDFNTRNMGFRRAEGFPSLCVYDWELATTGLPQHDLAELLCFVLPAETDQATLLHYLELHRMALQSASGCDIDRSFWKEGFRLSLYDLMINRLPAYAMIHHFNRQRFLERVICTWKGLFDVVSSSISPLF